MSETSTEVPTFPSPDQDQPNISQPEKDNIEEIPAYTSNSSVLKATKEQFKQQTKKGAIKRGESPGDNPNTGMSNANVKKEIPIPVPSPRFTVFKSDATNPAQTSKRFYAYWNELPGWAKDRLILYVYRDWPALIQLADDSKEFAYIDKISGGEPLQDDIDLLNRYGTGSYRLMLTDKTCICTVYVVNLGISDMKAHPPVDRRISDVSQVDLEYPANKSYVEFLRMAGKLPEQQQGKVAEAEMAQVQLVEKLMDKNDKLQERALKIAEAQDKSTPGSEETLKILAQASINANEIQADAAKRSNEMLHETVREMRALEASAKSSGGSSLIEALELLEKLRSGENSEVVTLRATIEQMRSDQLKSLQDQLTALKTAPAANSSPSATMKESITAFKEMRDLVEDVVGGGNKPNPVEEIGDAAGIPKWLQLSLQYGLPVINNVLSIVMASRGLTPTPPMPDTMSPGATGMGQAPGMPPNPAQPRPMPSGPPQGPPMANNPGLPAPVPTPAPGASNAANAGSQTDRTPTGLPAFGIHPDIAELLWEIKTPISNYLSTGDSGEDYAGVFCDNYGIDNYNLMKSFGVEGITTTIAQFPPIANRLVALGIGIERLQKFVTEFVEAELIQEPGEEGNNNGTASGTGTGTGSGSGPAA